MVVVVVVVVVVEVVVVELVVVELVVLLLVVVEVEVSVELDIAVVAVDSLVAEFIGEVKLLTVV